jgi:hypothetical protein
MIDKKNAYCIGKCKNILQFIIKQKYVIHVVGGYFSVSKVRPSCYIIQDPQKTVGCTWLCGFWLNANVENIFFSQ